MKEPEEVSDWGRVHARIVELGRERAGRERELVRWLLAAQRLGVHAHAGYASIGEYGDRVLGLTPRQTAERLRVGRALGSLRELDAALGRGDLGWSVVRELTRVATPDTERAWLDWAKTRRYREVERAVACRRPGDGPNSKPDPRLLRHRLFYEVRAETMALFRDLEAAVRGDLGAQGIEADDDAVLYEIARRALGGPADEGRASYQVAVSRCDGCGTTSIDAGGERHEVDEVVAEMAACDGQVLHASSTRAGDRRRRATQTIPPAIRREVMRRDGRRCTVPGCRNARFLDVHHLDPRAEGGGHHPDRLAVLCGAHHRSVHAGALCITGTASRGLSFYHADGTPYGGRLQPRIVQLSEWVLSVLKTLGFKPTRARALVDEVLRAGAPDDADAFLRAALQVS